MNITYSLGVIGRDGMYSYGRAAATPELARLNKGHLHRLEGERLAIYERRALPGTWTDSSGNQHQRYDDPVLVEVEEHPGQWVIA